MQRRHSLCFAIDRLVRCNTGAIRLITNQANAKVWEWNNDDPFGNNAPNDDPNNTGNHFVYNPRLPGQYFDSETNTHYNYFRDYDPATGRYIESDPIGLEGGINTYGYVGGNPLSKTDTLGLLLDGPSGGGGNGTGARRCHLTAQILMYYKFLPWLPGPLAVNYCVYKCPPLQCPGNSEFVTKIQTVWNFPFSCPATIEY